jgi:hypothetical protein
MLDRKRQARTRPYAVLGAGDLVSHLQRRCGNGEPARYRFNLFRICPGERVTHALRPGDLRDIVKLCQVVAFTIADDDWIHRNLRRELVQLADELDQVTRNWSESDDGPETTS